MRFILLCIFIFISSYIFGQTSCSTWLLLGTPLPESYVTIGDLDISGNQITIEANFNQTFLSNGFPGNLISKHSNTSDNNYFLSTRGCGITTTISGYKTANQTCPIPLLQTSHVEMVYDGINLKFYRNGFLMSQTACTGNLINNNLLTTIGQIAGTLSANEQFIGYMNEVRIWNVARTQSQLRTYMNSSLPNPTTQVGLRGYYIFASLINQQGNSAYNGSSSGNAISFRTNPNCNLTLDSCNVIIPNETIINNYTPILNLDTNSCKNVVTVENASAYNIGDTVLMIQMKGAIIDSTNTASFGTIIDYKSAGNYEFNYVKSKTGNQIELKNKILRTYEIPIGKVQLIRVPYYQNYTTSNTLTCLPWNGKIGGVLVFNVNNILTLNHNIDVTGKGFRGGLDSVSNPPVFYCGENQYYYPQNPDLASGKGEGIAEISSAKSYGKGALANGGGGGNSHNSAGGGGSNGALGGLGGYQFEGGPCTGSSIDSRGVGGKLLTYNNALNKIFLGGGGGAGQSNNFGNFQSLGGNGSGIIIISSNGLQSNNNKILANGNTGVPCMSVGSNCHEGMGGGGAGGSTLLNITNYLDNISCENKGGKGADMQSYGNLKVGPGGGGGAGILWLKQPTTPANVISINTGGINGVCLGYSNDSYGATAGLSGQTLFNLNLPITTVPFKPNIDSVRINALSTSCTAFNFSGLGYTNTNPIASWQWNFGDNTTGIGQNVSHSYSTSSTFSVTLVVTDVNGCKDSIVRNFTTNCTAETIINNYTPVLSLDPCKNILNVGNATAYNVGDTVLLIQMKGAIIDSTNTAAFGTITDYKSAGNYEYNYVKSKTGNQIELKNKILRTYEIPTGKVQLIRVPYYQNYSTTSTLTCLPWDGSIGGVLVFNVANTLTLNNNIDVSEKGFKGGIDPVTNPPVFYCGENQFYYPQNPDLASGKGEGIALISTAKSFGKGALANGGGGGNSHNSGGGGGSNGAVGGLGGYQFEGSACSGSSVDNRGVGGKILTYNNAVNKIFLGGGGGAGHSNNFENFQALGGNGSGMIIISAASLQSNGNKILANGAVGLPCGNSGSGCHEGMGGGGAGGSTLLNITTYLDNISCENKGGKGADMQSTGNLKVGPGGGGGAGIVWLKQPTTPASVIPIITGGLNGVCTGYGNDPFGSTAGLAGQTLFNLNLPITTIPFKPNIDSVKINALSTSCQAFNFSGLGYTNTSPIASWQWNFGDNTTGIGQNVSHSYSTSSTFSVTLVVTDVNGCKDSIVRNFTTNCTAETIINNYTPVLSLDPCKNILNVGNATAYNVGDTVLLIQMKGAIIDSTNTAAFGTITDYKSAGNYEYNYVKSKTGNQIELKNKILRTYEIPNGKVQLIRVPYYQNYSTTSTLTCLPWDGSIGGVLVFNVANTLTLNNNIDVSEKGFKGGIDPVTNPPVFYCGENQFYYPQNPDLASGKGEGIALISTAKSFGKGALANGGGGGNSHNSGGGGGSNGAVGGLGGYQFEGSACSGSSVDNRGIGGKILTYNNAVNKVFLGGGGGAGHSNNFENFQALGGNGSGMIIISAASLQSNGNKILANGAVGLPCGNSGSGCHEGMGGGGAGGSTLLNITTYLDNISCENKGGKGADMQSTGNLKVGPGGGGGAGIVWLKQPTTPASVIPIITGGLNGVCTGYANDPFGSTAGLAGQTLFNLNLPITTIPFKLNIDSVKINALSTSCQAFNFTGLGYTNTSPIASWQWNFGDNTTGVGQNVSHTYSTSSTFPVTLVVTDINGCKDSIIRNVTTNTLTLDAGLDRTFCGSQTGFQLLGSTAATGLLTYAWTSIPATTISNTSIINPIANISATTTFYFSVTNAQGCSGLDSIKVIINPIPIVQTINDISICKGSSLQLSTTLGLNTYQWSPGMYVSDSTISNPIFSDTIPRTLIVTGSNGFCSSKDTINIGIKPLPNVRTIKDTIICSTQSIDLTTTGAASYSWAPPTNLNSTIIFNPTFNGNQGNTYYVTGTGANGCIAKDTVVVTVKVPNSLLDPPNKSFCKNDSVMLDGFNGTNVLYSWQPVSNLSNPTIINPIANPIGTTPYTVNITEPVCNYNKTFVVLVTVNPLPVITATKSNDISCSKTSATLIANGAISYLWDNASSLSNINIKNPIAKPTTSTLYTVIGTDINGCKNSDKINVLVNLGKNVFDLPNTFTPNADNKNDCFGVINWGNAQTVFFIIYNRWGEKVFETNSIKDCWNGRYKGQPAEIGNYVYYITARTECGEIVRKGNVLLIR